MIRLVFAACLAVLTVTTSAQSQAPETFRRAPRDHERRHRDRLCARVGAGIRAGKQAPLFAQGNAYVKKSFPKLDYIKTARVMP